MNKADEQTSFEQAFEHLRSAAGGMMNAAYGPHDKIAKELYDAVKPVLTKVSEMAAEMRASKRSARREELVKQTPEEGSECFVDICPDGYETWEVVGSVVAAWIDDSDDDPRNWRPMAVVDITRPLTDQENIELSGESSGWQSDDTWTGCRFMCGFCIEDWRAKFPCNETAAHLWKQWGGSCD